MNDYKQSITRAMDDMAADPKTLFVGYGLNSGRAMGTLVNVPSEQLIEFPVAEGLMMSAAIGMSLMGFRPVVYLERMDFLMNAMDALVNHLNAAQTLSHGEFSPALIIRATVGNRQKPNFTGQVHTQDFKDGLLDMVGNLRIRILSCGEEVAHKYKMAKEKQCLGESQLLVEYKDLM